MLLQEIKHEKATDGDKTGTSDRWEILPLITTLNVDEIDDGWWKNCEWKRLEEEQSRDWEEDERGGGWAQAVSAEGDGAEEQQVEDR